MNKKQLNKQADEIQYIFACYDLIVSCTGGEYTIANTIFNVVLLEGNDKAIKGRGVERFKIDLSEALHCSISDLSFFPHPDATMDIVMTHQCDESRHTWSDAEVEDIKRRVEYNAEHGLYF